MSAMKKTLAVAGVAGSIYGRWRFRHIMTNAMTVIGLTIISAMLVGALLIGALYAAYFSLVQSGWEPHVAMLLTGILLVLAAAMCIVLIAARLRRLRPSSITHRTSEAIDAFFDGLMASGKR